MRGSPKDSKMERALSESANETVRDELKRLVEEVGISIFPVGKDKRPLVSHWKTDCTKEMSQVDEWLDKHGPNVNWAMPTGPDNGYWALDLDRKDGKDGLKFIIEKFGAVKGQTQRTMSGGLHKIFKCCAEQGTLKSRANVFGKTEGKDTGVDIRYNGGYILIDPSEGYRMTTKFDLDVDLCPDNLFQLLKDDEGPTALEKPVANRQKMGEERLTEVLMALPVDDPYLLSREGWQEIMRAVHSESEGEEWGKELFTRWSLQYEGNWQKDPEAEIARDWNSYSPDGNTSGGTLIYHCQRLECLPQAPSVIEPEDAVDFKRTKAAIMTTRQGAVKPNVHNCMEILRCTQVGKQDNLEFSDLFVFNEMTRDICWFKSPIWDKKKKAGSAIEETDITMLRALISPKFLVDFADDTMKKSVAAYATQRKTHPVRNYLKGLKWDEQERLSTWLIDSCGLEDNAYTRAVGRAVLVSAVARVMSPGCKVDNVLVLEGDQGCRKSTLVEIIGRTYNFPGPRKKKGWYGSPELNIKGLSTGDTDAVTNTYGCWVIEMAEMKAISNADELQVKDFLSTSEDRVTLKYDKFAMSSPRQYILVGTKNPYGEGRYIKDHTGARRYWPVKVTKTEENPIDIDAVDDVMDQLYAEAYVAWSKGEKFHLTGEALRLAKEYQAARIVGNERKSEVDRFFQYGAGKTMDKFHTADVLRKIWPTERKFTQYHRDSLAEYMKAQGWESSRGIRIDNKQSTGWKK
jgi:predicted P-loop ATPase